MTEREKIILKEFEKIEKSIAKIKHMLLNENQNGISNINLVALEE